METKKELTEEQLAQVSGGSLKARFPVLQGELYELADGFNSGVDEETLKKILPDEYSTKVYLKYQENQ